MKEPNIRFKGFRGEWEESTIGKVTSVKRGVRVTRKNLSDHGLYPVYQNTDYPMGYYNRYNVKSNNPFVIIGGSAGLIGFCDKEFWAADDCAYFSDSVKLDKFYLYCMLLNKSSEIKKNVRGSSVPRLDRQVINDLNISLSSIKEQQSIASYFQHLDALIQSTTKKIESLKQVKAASLLSMFPQEGETVPKLRFKGFEGEWKTTIVREICSVTNGKSNTQDQTSDGKYPFFIRSEKVMKSNRYLYDGEAVITIGDGQIGKVFHYINGKFDLHQRCYMMYNFHNIIGRFFFYFFSTSFYSRVMKMSAKATVDSVRLNMITEMPIYYPNKISEQVKIASYFTNLDRQITLQSQRLEKLKQIKAACLDKMFV